MSEKGQEREKSGGVILYQMVREERSVIFVKHQMPLN